MHEDHDYLAFITFSLIILFILLLSLLLVLPRWREGEVFVNSVLIRPLLLPKTMNKKPQILNWLEKEKPRNEKRYIFFMVSSRWRIAMGVLVSFLTIGLALGLSLTLTKDHDIPAGEGKDTIVDLGYSKYRGKAIGDGTSHWLGMRYAAPPLGNLRFAAPHDPEHNSTIQAANKVRNTPRVQND